MMIIKVTLNEAEDAAVLAYLEPLIAQGGRAATIARNMLHRCTAYESTPQVAGEILSRPILQILDNEEKCNNLENDLLNLFE